MTLGQTRRRHRRIAQRHRDATMWQGIARGLNNRLETLETREHQLIEEASQAKRHSQSLSRHLLLTRLILVGIGISYCLRCGDIG